MIKKEPKYKKIDKTVSEKEMGCFTKQPPHAFHAGGLAAVLQPTVTDAWARGALDPLVSECTAIKSPSSVSFEFTTQKWHCMSY
jgi:hypothetical protein